MKLKICIIALATLAGCAGNGESADTQGEAAKTPQAQITDNYVDTMRLAYRDFRNQTVCNGTLRAIVKSQLSTLHSDPITEIHAQNGQHVAKGALLAVTDTESARRDLDNARHDLEKSEIELLDKLISMGYNSKDDVPADMLKRVEVTSGYYSARHNLAKSEKNLKDCYLYAPISGIVADLEGKLYQKSDKFCTIIDNTAFNVEFSVLEAELPNIKAGHTVKVSAFADEALQRTGSITTVNPTVDEKGLVKVGARIPGGDARLIDGMNVRVVVERSVPKMLVVPKDAVVERDGYNVVFVYSEGKAVWTYVDIVHSNLNSYAITGCAKKETTINPGDIVITSGNMNLADGTPVSIAAPTEK